MKNRFLVILIIAVSALLLIFGIAVRNKPSGRIANVYQNGNCIRSIDLSGVREPFIFSVKDSKGHENIIEVEPGRIRVKSANCPDQICVNTGWLSEGITPIVCMPARLSIQLENKSALKNNDIDAVTR